MYVYTLSQWQLTEMCHLCLTSSGQANRETNHKSSYDQTSNQDPSDGTAPSVVSGCRACRVVWLVDAWSMTGSSFEHRIDWTNSLPVLIEGSRVERDSRLGIIEGNSCGTHGTCPSNWVIDLLGHCWHFRFVGLITVTRCCNAPIQSTLCSHLVSTADGQVDDDLLYVVR